MKCVTNVTYKTQNIYLTFVTRTKVTENCRKAANLAKVDIFPRSYY
jgi:hypothetical protein